MGFNPKIPTQNPFYPFVSQEKVRIKNSRRENCVLSMHGRKQDETKGLDKIP